MPKRDKVQQLRPQVHLGAPDSFRSVVDKQIVRVITNPRDSCLEHAPSQHVAVRISMPQQTLARHEVGHNTPVKERASGPFCRLVSLTAVDERQRNAPSALTQRAPMQHETAPFCRCGNVVIIRMMIHSDPSNSYGLAIDPVLRAAAASVAAALKGISAAAPHRVVAVEGD